MNQQRAKDLTQDPFFARLKGFIIEATGMVFYADKDDDLARIVGHRLDALGLASCSRYLEVLSGEDGAAELDELVAELTIGETYFFRHLEQFNALRDVVLPQLLERNSDTRRLRIWSAGCATGAEPYTVAILLKRDLARETRGWDIDILGTDINKRFLAKARRARYKPWALRTTSDETARTCFDREGDSWVLKPQFRDLVSFQYHNLVENPFPSMVDNLVAFDVILCRNVTIYFNRDTVRRLIGQFHDTLVDGGWLLPGHAETDIDLFRQFRTVNCAGAVLYQKAGGHEGEVLDMRRPDAERLVVPKLGEWTPPSLPVGEPLDRPAPPDLSWEPSQAEAPQAEPASEPEKDPEKAAGDAVAASTEDELRRVRRLADLGEWGEAASRCERLLEAGSKMPSVHLYYALVLEQMGNAVGAEQALRRAIFIDRGYALGHYQLGLFLQKKGDVKAAARHFQTVCRLLRDAEGTQGVEDEDGMTVAQLRDLAKMQLEVVEQA